MHLKSQHSEAEAGGLRVPGQLGPWLGPFLPGRLLAELLCATSDSLSFMAELHLPDSGQRWGDGTSLRTLTSPRMLARMTNPKSAATYQHSPIQGFKDGNSCVTAHVTLAEEILE